MQELTAPLPMPANVIDIEPRSQDIKFTHVPALDGVRGIAIIVVMAYHMELLVPELHPYVIGGFLGVDIFFVLSGFLITSILLGEYKNTSSISLKNFYFRRSLRLIPAFWFFLICIYIFGSDLLTPTHAGLIYGRYDFVYAVTYTMNWFSSVNTGLDSNLNHVWSLSIEEQFYVIWSVVLYILLSTKLKDRKVFYLVLGVVAALCLARAARALTGTDSRTLYYSTDTRIDSLLIGCATSMIFIWKLTSKNAVKTLGFKFLCCISLTAALAVMLGTSHEDLDLYVIGLPIFNFSIAVMLFWLVSTSGTFVHKILEIRVLRWIGKISYGLYLWHYLMYGFALKELGLTGSSVLVGIASAFAIATVSYYLIEKPFLKLKFRYSYKTVNA